MSLKVSGRRTRGLACALLLAVTHGPGCAGGSAIDRGEEFVVAYCNLLEPCCVKAGLPGRGQSCRALLDLGYHSPGATYDPAAGQACLNSLKQQSTQPDFCMNIPPCDPFPSPPISGIAPGSRAPGELCGLDSDCAAPPNGLATCWLGTGTLDGGWLLAGTCVQLAAGQAGQAPCVPMYGSSGSAPLLAPLGPTPSSGQAYVCNATDGVECNEHTLTCTALGATGAACTTDRDCVTSDACAGLTCIPRLADGAPCPGYVLGDYNPCQNASFCIVRPTSATCTPLLPTGAGCNLGEECQGSQCVDGLCTNSSQGFLELICAL